MVPSDEALQQIAVALGFPVAFFHKEEVNIPNPQAVSFRSLSRMTASTRHRAIASGVLGVELAQWIDSRFNLPVPDLPDLRETDPETSADNLRTMWGLGRRPIRNVVHLLESKGVRVFSLAQGDYTVDAFSMWTNEQPYVFLNTTKSAERSRFDACHELLHLVAHRHAQPNGKEAESEADAFASAFLMPRDDIIARAPRRPTLSHLMELKSRWGVSLVALIYRLHKTGMISEWNYRQLMKSASKRGYRTDEPNSRPRERSQILDKVLASLRKQKITSRHIAADLNIQHHDLTDLLFGLTNHLLPIDGERSGSSLKNPDGLRKQLKLIT